VLSSIGEELRKRGVRFTDLTMIFRETTEPTYLDDCCHYTDFGEILVAEAIAGAIVEDFRADP
jgi:hypothetical protein